jgi:uncharacterized membrane protein YgcG
MQRKWILSLIVLSSMLFSLAAAQAGRDYFARSYTTDITLQVDGDLLITETVTFEFIGGPFTFVFREIPTDFTDGISDITASMDGRILSQGTGAGQYEVEPGNPTRITWHFEGTQDQTRTFMLQYRVLGAVRQEAAADRLEWNLLPTEYEYRIQSVEALIMYPDNIPLQQPPQIVRGQANIETETGTVVLRSTDVGPDEPLQVALQFPPGSLIAAPPAWQLRTVQASEIVRQMLPFSLLTGIAALLLGIALFVLWRRRAIQTEVDIAPAGEMPKRMSPPADLPPAYAGLISKKSDQAAWSHALGTLIDLSRRGWIQLIESKKGVFKSRTFEIHALREPDSGSDLRPHEQGLMEMLFTHRNRSRDHINAQELSSAVSSRFKLYKEPLRQEMENEGYIDPQRRSTRNGMYAVAVILLLLGMAITIAAFILGRIGQGGGNWSLLQLALVTGPFFAGLTVAGIVGLILASGLSPLSDRVAQQAREWQSFSEYLKDVTRNREPVVRPDLFEAYLPYAASFGLADAWAKYFQKQGMQQAPAWFVSATPGEDMTAFIAVMAATSSTGDASSGGGAGSGGAGGGGASGAG